MSIFGSTDKSAQRKQIAANEQARQFIEQMGAQARGDALSLYPSAMYNRNLGYQGALDTFGQTMPQQFDVFRQGNVGAQAALLGGQQQMQNAILGLPVDMSGFTPQGIDVDTSFAQQQLPNFVNPELTQAAALGGTGAPLQATGQTPGAAATQTPSTSVPGGPGGRVGPIAPGPAGNAGFGNTYNPGTVGQIFGEQPIGSLNQLEASEQGGNIGRLASALSGIPLLGMAGNWLGNRNIANKVWMSPVDPNNPYETPITTPGLQDLFPGQEELPSSPLLPPQFQSAGTGLAGNLAAGVLYQRDPNDAFAWDMSSGDPNPELNWNSPYRSER